MHKPRKLIKISACIIIACFSLSIMLFSCEKQVNIHLNAGANKLVVEGQIENGQPPFVVLTTSQSFFSQIDLSTIEGSFIHGANITVSDSSRTITLREYTLDTGGNYKFYVYTIDSADPGSFSFVGQIGKSYTLTINYNGQAYTSTTKIPTPMAIDSLTTKPPIETDPMYPTEISLFINFRDPDTLGNYVKYFTKRNSEPYFAGGTYSDEITNGAPVNFPIFPGYNTQNPDSGWAKRFFVGDTVTVKWSSIDKGVYTFWETFQYATNVVGNPFASPINVQSNISNGALGVWAGYGSTNTTLIITH